jgi:hypothetical protein
MILRSLGLPSPQQNEMAALTLLALCGLHPSDAWDRARRYRVGISKDIMVFIKEAGTNASGKSTNRAPFAAASRVRWATFSIVASRSIITGAACTGSAPKVL